MRCFNIEGDQVLHGAYNTDTYMQEQTEIGMHTLQLSLFWRTVPIFDVKNTAVPHFLGFAPLFSGMIFVQF